MTSPATKEIEWWNEIRPWTNPPLNDEFVNLPVRHRRQTVTSFLFDSIRFELELFFSFDEKETRQRFSTVVRLPDLFGSMSVDL